MVDCVLTDAGQSSTGPPTRHSGTTDPEQSSASSYRSQWVGDGKKEKEVLPVAKRNHLPPSLSQPMPTRIPSSPSSCLSLSSSLPSPLSVLCTSSPSTIQTRHSSSTCDDTVELYRRAVDPGQTRFFPSTPPPSSVVQAADSVSRRKSTQANRVQISTLFDYALSISLSRVDLSLCGLEEPEAISQSLYSVELNDTTTLQLISKEQFTMTAPTAPVQMKRTVQRITRGSVETPGRKLTYSLTVIQQPERARACGSGAKSSADRRPVNPPPVVELRIFEGDGPNPEDVTFAYEANFFLFATLEAARPIARGRGLQQAAATPIPVLTGMPVSGMAYLDRPTEAGYFIFPDLSVRHEGTYCLSFNLYEETKHDHDKDPESSGPKPAHLNGPGAPDKSFDWRLEVKSAPFTVFSAKKFPGLAESTHLSRTVAEQGCRVRIRRDVRMRRRDTKESRDFEDAPEDDYARRGREVTSEPFRERSNSADSHPGSPVYAVGSHPQDHGHNPYPPGQSGSGGHLSFIDNARPQFQTPSHFAPPQPPAPPSYQQPSNYNPPGPSQYRPPPPPAPPASNYGYDRPYPHSAYPTNPPRDTYEQEIRRSSYPAPAPSYPPVDASYSRPQFHAPSPAALPPLRLPPTDPKRDNVSSPLGPIVPPVSSNYPRAAERAQERIEPYDHYSTPAEPRNGKRTYDAVFSATASAIDSQRLANGERPNTNKEAEDDDEEEIQPKLVYSRANGARVSRECPPLVS